MNSSRGHRSGRSGPPTDGLAAELRRVILQVDSEPLDEYGEDRTPSRPVSERLGFEAGSLSELIKLIEGVRTTSQGADAELTAAIRQLSDILSASRSEIKAQMFRTEQSIQDQISSMESRIRGDLASLRSEATRWDLDPDR